MEPACGGMENGKGEFVPNVFGGVCVIIDLNACSIAYFFTIEETMENAADNAIPIPIQKTGEPIYDDGGGIGGRVPVPVEVFSLLVEDDMLAKAVVFNPSKTFLDPRAAAETTSRGLLAPLRPAPAESDVAGRGCEGRRAAGRGGRRGYAEHEEARMRLSMPHRGRKLWLWPGSRGSSLSCCWQLWLTRARVLGFRVAGVGRRRGLGLLLLVQIGRAHV